MFAVLCGPLGTVVLCDLPRLARCMSRLKKLRAHPKNGQAVDTSKHIRSEWTGRARSR